VRGDGKAGAGDASLRISSAACAAGTARCQQRPAAEREAGLPVVSEEGHTLEVRDQRIAFRFDPPLELAEGDRLELESDTGFHFSLHSTQWLGNCCARNFFINETHNRRQIILSEAANYHKLRPFYVGMPDDSPKTIPNLKLQSDAIQSAPRSVFVLIRPSRRRALLS
jgi:hypothetical protein